MNRWRIGWSDGPFELVAELVLAPGTYIGQINEAPTSPLFWIVNFGGDQGYAPITTLPRMSTVGHFPWGWNVVAD